MNPLAQLGALPALDEEEGGSRGPRRDSAQHPVSLDATRRLQARRSTRLVVARGAQRFRRAAAAAAASAAIARGASGGANGGASGGASGGAHEGKPGAAGAAGAAGAPGRGAPAREKTAPRDAARPIGSGHTGGDAKAAPSHGPAPVTRAGHGKTRRSSAAHLLQVAELQKQHNGGTATANTTMMNQGIPLREGLQLLYKVHRDKFLCEAIVFTAFVLCFVLIVYDAYNVPLAWEQDHGLIDRFLDEEFPGSTYKKNFWEIMTYEEYWEWLKGPVFDGMYPDQWYNGDLFNGNETGYLLHALQLVGTVQLRQMRVKKDGCESRRFLEMKDSQGRARFDNRDGGCYPEFHQGSIVAEPSEADTPFGPPEDPDRYVYSCGVGSDEGLADLWGLYGFGPSDYGTCGYVQYLSRNRTEAWGLLQQLERDRWVDQQTRAVALTFNLYNTNTRLATTSRFLIEFYSSGALMPSFEMYSYRLVLYNSRVDTFRGLIEIVYLVLFFYQVQKEVKRLSFTHPRIRYFTRFKNMFELVFLSMHAVMIATWLRFLFSDKRLNYTVTSPTYENYFDLAYDYLVTFTIAGMNCLMSCFKLFKYLSINNRMNTLWLTLQRASYDLFIFFIGLCIIVLGFAMMGNFFFGHILRDFHNMPSSISTLTRFTLGDFDYDELVMARPRLAAPFFWLYTAVVFVVIMNMFIAIITRYFESVHSEAKTADKWKEGMPDLTWDIIKAVRRWCRANVKPRCNLGYSCITCKVCRKRDELPRALRHPFRPPQRHSLGALGTAPSDAEEAADLQQNVWEREADLEQQMRECAHAAKVHKHRSLDLFEYFNHAYRETSANQYVSMDELCQITNESSGCTHEDCVAKCLVLAYTNLKEVVLIGGVERRGGSANLARRARYQYRYTVHKVNKWGRRQQRIVAVDSKSCEMHSFDLRMNLKQALPLNLLVQCEVSHVDGRRLKLVFGEGITLTGGGAQYKAVFQDSHDRDEFKELVLRVANSAYAQQRAKEHGGDRVATAEVAAAAAHAVKTDTRIDKVLAVNSEVRRDLRVLAQNIGVIGRAVGALEAKIGGRPGAS